VTIVTIAAAVPATAGAHTHGLLFRSHNDYKGIHSSKCCSINLIAVVVAIVVVAVVVEN